ncbi:DUF6603 domain-containing protein [Phytohabitans rumicis]|uniref:DUF6603 domain-containing protein n=1 Tax=Phytohabitans rumicis TaxID=1076125 RepID=A0A6V8KXW5_9ACTN|nr:DUF6603 domain-containing protein [Phytohabitans rumicis]GFJ87169.1 hypothetical protein Prum_008110 [Phytohabitans rumicis]
MIGIDVPEELIQVGLMLGLLRLEHPGDLDSVALDTGFFADPAGALSGLAYDPDRRAAALGLAAKLFGEVGQALDLPELPEGQTWVPIVRQGSAGLFAIVDAADGRIDLGIGGRAAVSRDGLEAAATVALPIARADQGAGVSLLPGTPDGPIRLGVGVQLPPPAPGDLVSLAGIAVTADLPTAPGGSPSLVVRLRGLRLPAWPEPRDRTLTDDPAAVGRELVELLHGLLEARAGLGDAGGAKLRALLALLGLGGRDGIPALPLADVLDRGPAALVDWLRSLVAPGTPWPLVSWLRALADLLDLELPDGIEGSGTAADPVRWCARPASGVEVHVRVVVEEAGGALTIRPSVEGSLRTGSAATVPGSLRMGAEVCAITLGATPAVDWLPRLDAAFELARTGGPLVRVPATGSTVDLEVGVFRAGLAAGSDHRPALVVEAVDVTLDGTAYPRLDLSSVEAVAAAASAAAGDALAAALDGFFGAGSGRGRALTNLLGLTRPVPAAQPWPALPAVPELFADPLGAWARYHAGLLVGGVWSPMAGDLAVVLGATAPGPAGGGEADPWRLGLAGGAGGDLELRLWRSGPDAAPGLHIAVEFAPAPVQLDGHHLRLRGLIQLARVALPVTAPDGPVLSFADRAEIRLELGDDLVLDGPVEVRAGAASAVVGWRRGEGWVGGLRVTGAVVTAGGESVALPDPFDLGTGLPGPGSPVWSALEWLFARWLAGAAGGAARAILAGLLGWLPSRRLRLGGDAGPDLDIADLAAGGWPRFPLERLATDPVAAVRDWLAEVLSSGAGPDLADMAVGFLNGLLAGAGSDAVDLRTDGAGTRAEPWRVGLTTDPRAPVVLVWLDPDGPTMRELDGVLDTLVPGDLSAGLDGSAPLPDEARLAGVLRVAARFDAGLGALLAGRGDVARVLSELRTGLRDTDGLVPAAAQAAAGDVRGATLDGVTHLGAPAAFNVDSHAPDAEPERVVYVAAPLPGVSPWPGQPAGPDPRLLDLRAAGVPPEAFGFAGLAGPGPWWVLLPTRADAGGADAVAARLRAAVRAIRAASPGPVTLVAHSVAGHAARAVWASGDAESLVTLGTPYAAAVPTDAAAEAVQLLRGLTASLPGAPDADLRRLLDLLRTRAAVLGESQADDAGVPAAHPFPVADLTAAPLPAAPAGAAAPVALRTSCTDVDLHRGVAAAVRAAAARVRSLLPHAAAGRTRAPVTHLGLGLAAGWPAPEAPGTDPGGLRTEIKVRLDGCRVPLRGGGGVQPVPRIAVQAALWRDGGWLVGSASSGADPRLRRLDLDLTIDRSAGGVPDIRASLALHDAGLTGIDHGRLDLPPGPLDGVARALLGEVSAALSPAPATGPIRDLLDVLAALGVASVDGAGTVALHGDPLERILVDTAGYLGTHLAGEPARTRLLAALGRLLGAAPGQPPGRPLGPDFHLSIVDGSEVTVGTADGGVLLGGLIRLAGRVTLGPSARVRGELRLGSGTALVVATDSAAGPATVRLEVAAGRPEPDRIPIAPVLDADALAGRLGAAAAAELLRGALEWAREREARLDPLLAALGLLLPGSPPAVRSPVELLLDPGGWLTGPAALGDPARPGVLAPAKLAALAAAAGQLLGQPAGGSPGPAPLGLPGGGTLAVAEDGDGLVVTVRIRPAPTGGLGADVALIVRVAPGPVVRTTVRAAVRRTGTAGFRDAGLELEAGQVTTLTVRLTPVDPAAAELVLPLLPQAPGLGALTELAAIGAVGYALPRLLEALTGAGAGDPRMAQLGAALGQLGDALDIRDAASGAFRIGELRRLAADPPSELATRFRARPAATIGALRALVAAVTGTPAGAGPLWSGAGGRVAVDVAATGTGSPEVRLRATALVPVDGITAGGEAAVNAAGLAAARLSVTATDADALLPGPVDLLPFVAVTLGPALPETFEVGLWLDPPARTTRDALLIRVTFGVGTQVLHRRVTPAGTTDSTNLATAVPALVRRLAVPLAADFALARPALRDLLATSVGTQRIGDILVAAGVLAADGAGWRLADGLMDQLTIRAPRAVAELLIAAGGPRLGPFQLAVRAETGPPVPAGSIRYVLRVALLDPIEPPAVGGLILSVEGDDAWDPPLPGPAGDHLELSILELPADPFAPGATVRATPAVRLRGLGLRVRAEQGPLVDFGVRVGSIGLHVAFAQDAGGFGYGGARLIVDGLAIDLGSAGGGNPVAGKVLSPGPGAGGDPEPVAPGFSAQLRVFKEGTGPVGVTVRAGLGPGPWWIPIQRSFGPVYVAQVGLDVTTAGGRPAEVSLLIDGGATLGGLAVGVDDLELIVPWATAANPLTWRVDLAGLAVAYQNGGIALAGGLRKLERLGGVEYAGMLVLRAAGFGLDVIGSWGEFPVPGGGGGRYTSLFIFGALSAPLGGPPPFFVTGIGAGVGINRALAVPDDLAEVTDFPLVEAMSPGNALAQDPMAALEEIARAFPPSRGAFWLAAGVRFTSFTVVESVAVLAVAVGDGVEVVILGTSRMGLPNPSTPLVMIELALKARFSTREGVLSIQAQLTENSWLLNPGCRLTGGFAFVIWFRTGELLLTLGGYHPRFQRPERYPVVPRLGLQWSVSQNIVVKGEAYFALTSTAVMAGGRIEVGFDGGFVHATFTAGVDAIVSWDPAWYDVTVYVQVSASLEIEIDLWILGTIRIWIGFSIGAELHVWGPRLRGEAIIDLDLVRFAVPFGASDAPIGPEPLGWSAFHDKYLVAGDPTGRTMDLMVTAGLHVPDPGGPGGPANDGSPDRPYQLGPEFALTSSTRTAANQVNEQPFTGLPLDLVPMRVERIASRHTVRIVDDETGVEVPADRRPQVTALSGPVPDGIWRLPEPGDMGEDGVHPAFTGARLAAVPALAGDAQDGTIDDVEGGDAHPLPLRDHRDPGQTLSQAMAAAAQWAATQQQADAFEVTAAALAGAALHGVAGAALARCLGARTARTAAAGPSGYALRLLAADRVAPPQLARITTGIVAPLSAPVPVTPAEPPAQPQIPIPGAPRLAALLWPQPARTLPTTGRTTVGSWGGQVRRRPPPTIEEARAGLPPLAAHLHLLPPQLGATTKGTLSGRDPASRFRRAGTSREWRREVLADPRPRALDAALATGVTLPAGQIQVWHVPRAGADRSAQRPVLTVGGNQLVRVVALGRTGAALDDRELTQGSVLIPLGAQRVAVIGTGRTAAARGLSGWYAGAVLARVHGSTCVLPGGLLRADAPPSLRGRAAVDAALVPGAEAVRGTGVTRTRLPADTSCVVVVLDVPAAGLPPAEGLLLGLDGATQPLDAAKVPLPPRAVVTGSRAYLFFDVTPGGGPVTVTVGRDRDWTLAGVLGAARPADLVAREVRRRGLDALLAPLTERAPRSSTLSWTGATP